MSHRGNGHDNAVAESVFALLKRERIRRKHTRRDAAARHVRTAEQGEGRGRLEKSGRFTSPYRI
nr:MULTISPECIES: hypothetical protein [unclassified Xanthobacter]